MKILKNALVLNHIILYYIVLSRIISYYLVLYYIFNCLCGSVAKASDTQAVGHGFDPRLDH